MAERRRRSVFREVISRPEVKEIARDAAMIAGAVYLTGKIPQNKRVFIPRLGREIQRTEQRAFVSRLARRGRHPLRARMALGRARSVGARRAARVKNYTIMKGLPEERSVTLDRFGRGVFVPFRTKRLTLGQHGRRLRIKIRSNLGL